MSETKWKPDQDRVRDLTNEMAIKLRGGMTYSEAIGTVFRGLRGNERAEYIAAVSSKLSTSAHIAEARRPPDMPVQKPNREPKSHSREQDKQLGFEGFEHEDKPPSPT